MHLKELLVAGLLTGIVGVGVCVARPPSEHVSGSGGAMPSGGRPMHMGPAAAPSFSYSVPSPPRTPSNVFRTPSSVFRSPSNVFRTPSNVFRTPTTGLPQGPQAPFRYGGFPQRGGGWNDGGHEWRHDGDRDHDRDYDHDRDRWDDRWPGSFVGFYPLPFYDYGLGFGNGFDNSWNNNWNTNYNSGYGEYSPGYGAGADPGPYAQADSPYAQPGPATSGPMPPDRSGDYPYSVRVPYAPPSQTAQSDPPAPPMPPITVVLHDGQRFSSQNYAVMNGTLWDFSKPVPRKVPLSTIDVPASKKATEDAGGEFPALTGEPEQSPTN